MSASGFQRDSVPQHSIQVTVDKTVLQLAAASFTPNQLANVTSLLSALYESKDEKALFCFDRDASDNGDANFQVLHGEVDEYLNLTLITKKVADSVRDVLFERIKDYLSDKTKEILLE
ncbi:hypothetical protein H0H93_004649 [Arthromyces matolae]|nr:hypothetical protein H0H93_004649 [Arthromyces matolae]